MKVDAIRLDLRPRGMFEAADLGVRLVSAHLRSVWTSCAPVYAFVAAASPRRCCRSASAGAVLTVIWLKPWLDRSILFVLARAVFGEETRFADVWAARRAVAWQGLLGALTIRRLSPWRSYVQPVLQLEGQRGKARRERVARILGAASRRRAGDADRVRDDRERAGAGLARARCRGSTPADDQSPWLALLFEGGSWLTGVGLRVPTSIAVAIVEPFFVGAGFAMYLNRRVELEAWDIEQEFRLAFAR